MCRCNVHLISPFPIQSPPVLQTLAGLISVMGKPGQGGKWGMGGCLDGSMWVSYLTRTAQTRPGNTGAAACVVVHDAERASFEKQASFEQQYGSIRDNTLNISARRPIYCPKILELTTLFATNGPSNIDLFQRFYSAIPLVEEGKHFYSWPYPLANPLTHAGFGVAFPIHRRLPTNHSRQSAAGAVYGSLAASIDVTYIAQKVLEELYVPGEFSGASKIANNHLKQSAAGAVYGALAASINRTCCLFLCALLTLSLPLPFFSPSPPPSPIAPSPPSHADSSKSFELYNISDPTSPFPSCLPPAIPATLIPLSFPLLSTPPTHPPTHPDSSKSFELYDITNPASLFAIVSPVPPHAYFRPDDHLPYMHPSRTLKPAPGSSEQWSLWRKWEQAHMQPPNTWQSWGIPILIALFALLLVLLVLLAAWLQRTKFIQTQQLVAEADRLRREADEAEASKSMFVACMSHELRTPMVGIIGMIDALADMGLNASQLADLLMDGASAKDALNLVNRVLDLAKLEAGKAMVDEVVVDVRDWLRAALDWHAEEARSKGIECE
ncbi:unnamed protein product [Closterium sp. Naga37s-1]|nr:unnamed protein product [Closterium sp. Naga37s-1]